MKQALTGISLISLLAISVFGLFLMGTMNGNCIAEAVNGGLCPQNAFAGLTFHLNAFRAFSNVTLNVASVMVLFALLSVAALFSTGKDNRILSPQSTEYANADSQFIPLQETFRNWLVLHEKRDPSSSV